MAGQADLKKVFGGGGGDVINSTKEIFTEDLKYTDENDAVWLRTGWVDTDIGMYPSATKTTIPLDVATNSIAYTASANVARIRELATETTRFSIRSDLTHAVVPCETTSTAVANLAFYTTDSGLTWNTASITAETTHRYENAAFSPTRCMFVGYSYAGGTSSGNSKIARCTQNLASFTAPFEITMSGAMFVTYTGSNFLVMSASGKQTRLPETTNTPTYLADAPFTNPRILTSPSNGVVCCADNSTGIITRIYRTVDEGNNWVLTLTLSDANWQYRPKALYKETTSGNLILVVSANNPTTSSGAIKFYVSTNDGVSFTERAWNFTWDGIQYNNVTGWPLSVFMNPSTVGNIPFNGLAKTGGVLRLPLNVGDTKLSYFQSDDNGLTWTVTRPAVRAGWSAQMTKTPEGFYAVGLANDIYGVGKDLQSPATSPVFRFAGTTTFVGITEELATNITTTSGKLAKYVRIK